MASASLGVSKGGRLFEEDKLSIYNSSVRACAYPQDEANVYLRELPRHSFSAMRYVNCLAGWELPKQSVDYRAEVASIAIALTQMRARSRLTQAEIAAAMGTTQTAIARLESGRQSPSLRTLQSYARAVGYCLEIGFIGSRPGEKRDRTGTILIVDDAATSVARQD